MKCPNEKCGYEDQWYTDDGDRYGHLGEFFRLINGNMIQPPKDARAVILGCPACSQLFMERIRG